MQLLDQRILIASIVEVQATINEALRNGEFELAETLWVLQREKGERLKNGNYYPKSDNRGTSETNQGDGQGG